MVGIFKDRQNVFLHSGGFSIKAVYCMENLFLEDVSKMNSDEIAVWLKKCRKEVKREKYNEYEDYIKDVASLCMDWENHYEKYKSTYDSKKFKKAILSLGVLERKYNINCDGKLEEIEKPVFFDILSSKKEIPEFNKIKKDFDFLEYCDMYSEDHSTDEHKLSFYNADDYKPMFIFALQQLLSNCCSYEIRVLRDKKLLKGLSYKQLMEELEKDKNLTIRTYSKKICNSYFKELEKYGVRSSAFSEFINPLQEQKHFEKQLFINICFACSMPLSVASVFLQYNGYSVENSTREFDKICEKSFRLGFPREYAMALIERYNNEHKDKPSFKKIYNL